MSALGTYQVKVVHFDGVATPIFLEDQREGPTALIAIANALSLSHRISVALNLRGILEGTAVSRQDLLGLVQNVLIERCKAMRSAIARRGEEIKLTVPVRMPEIAALSRRSQQALKCLYGETQAQINPLNSSPFAFEESLAGELALFDLLGLHLVHSWVHDDGSMSEVQENKFQYEKETEEKSTCAGVSLLSMRKHVSLLEEKVKEADEITKELRKKIRTRLSAQHSTNSKDTVTCAPKSPIDDATGDDDETQAAILAAMAAMEEEDGEFEGLEGDNYVEKSSDVESDEYDGVYAEDDMTLLDVAAMKSFEAAMQLYNYVKQQADNICDATETALLQRQVRRLKRVRDALHTELSRISSLINKDSTNIGLVALTLALPAMTPAILVRGNRYHTLLRKGKCLFTVITDPVRATAQVALVDQYEGMQLKIRTQQVYAYQVMSAIVFDWLVDVDRTVRYASDFTTTAANIKGHERTVRHSESPVLLTLNTIPPTGRVQKARLYVSRDGSRLHPLHLASQYVYSCLPPGASQPAKPAFSHLTHDPFLTKFIPYVFNPRTDLLSQLPTLKLSTSPSSIPSPSDQSASVNAPSSSSSSPSSSISSTLFTAIPSSPNLFTELVINGISYSSVYDMVKHSAFELQCPLEPCLTKQTLSSSPLQSIASSSSPSATMSFSKHAQTSNQLGSHILADSSQNVSSDVVEALSTLVDAKMLTLPSAWDLLRSVYGPSQVGHASDCSLCRIELAWNANKMLGEFDEDDGIDENGLLESSLQGNGMGGASTLLQPNLLLQTIIQAQHAQQAQHTPPQSRGPPYLNNTPTSTSLFPLRAQHQTTLPFSTQSQPSSRSTTPASAPTAKDTTTTTNASTASPPSRSSPSTRTLTNASPATTPPSSVRGGGSRISNSSNAGYNDMQALGSKSHGISLSELTGPELDIFGNDTSTTYDDTFFTSTTNNIHNTYNTTTSGPAVGPYQSLAKPSSNGLPMVGTPAVGRMSQRPPSPDPDDVGIIGLDNPIFGPGSSMSTTFNQSSTSSIASAFSASATPSFAPFVTPTPAPSQKNTSTTTTNRSGPSTS